MMNYFISFELKFVRKWYRLKYKFKDKNVDKIEVYLIGNNRSITGFTGKV